MYPKYFLAVATIDEPLPDAGTFVVCAVFVWLDLFVVVFVLLVLLEVLWPLDVSCLLSDNNDVEIYPSTLFTFTLLQPFSSL